ncbi:DNA-protecting protein DprA [Puniceicoccales bacterium CK1056]|uniref:DNA-protecting protein DprA n=1 Tax=Oceanipulchritudo coccoides TaxID=2706888 RepID=A0A6B2M2E4_9BACT|nr:DNA-processing protein DprA [Oceanipulchritudo coccoides]NDV62492.1 DNA-protecting protein DprA [Oceanipulchritudo coccoides]
MILERRFALMALAALPGLGPVNIRRLDNALGGKVEHLLEMTEAERSVLCARNVVDQLGEWQKYFHPERVGNELKRLKADFITSEESDYPRRLGPYSDRPIGLYRCREGRTFGERCVAIVGTRQPSAYGRKVAREFAVELSCAGFTVVSGMAEGIDTEAHRAALESGGRTAAVLGGGLNRCYPSSNRELMEEIVQSAGVWSEFPLWRSADRRSFPQRNRIVSGVSEAVLVVESGLKGGSLITARMASEQGKPVYIIPGRIDAPESAGCHSLIRDGAQLVTSVEEILEDLSYLPEGLKNPGWGQIPELQGRKPKPEPQLSGLEASVWKVLGDKSHAHADSLANELGVSVSEISRTVTEMEIAGHLARRLDGCYERN